MGRSEAKQAEDTESSQKLALLIAPGIRMPQAALLPGQPRPLSQEAYGSSLLKEFPALGSPHQRLSLWDTGGQDWEKMESVGGFVVLFIFLTQVLVLWQDQ